MLSYLKHEGFHDDRGDDDDADVDNDDDYDYDDVKLRHKLTKLPFH